MGFHFSFSFLDLYLLGVLCYDVRRLVDTILALEETIFHLNRPKNIHETFRGHVHIKLHH